MYLNVKKEGKKGEKEIIHVRSRCNEEDSRMEININRSSSKDFQKKIYFTKFSCYTNDKVERIFIRNNLFPLVLSFLFLLHIYIK